MTETYSVEAVLKAKATDFVNGFKQATSAATDFVDKNKKTFDSFKQVGAAATAGGVAVAGGLAFAVKKAEEFESGMSSVAAISGATGKDLQDLANTAREWGASTSFSATEAAEGLEYMALAGWDTQQMMGGIGPILHLAEAGALDLGRASDLVTDSMAGLGLEVDDLAGYLDKVATTAANSNTDIDALMEAFVIAGGKFKELNVPLEESTAFLGVLANRGFKASEAGTAVNAIMTRLTSTTGPAAKKLKEMGISAYDSEGNFRGMEAVMEDVRKKMDKMTDAERANASEKLAGLNHGKTFTAMLSGLGDEYGELKGKVEGSKGALVEMRNTMKDNLQGDLENLSSAFEEIAIAIGTVLLPHVKTMIEFIQSLADKFNSLDDKTITIIAVIAALSAGFLLLIGPILLLIGFIPSMLAGFTALSTVFAAITGPIGLTIAAIIAIGAALVIAYNKIEWFRDVVDVAWDAIKNIFSTALSFIKDNVVKPIISAISDLISGYLSRIKGLWSEHGALIMSIVKTTFNNIKAQIEMVMGIIRGVFQIVWPIISGIVKVTWALISTIINNTLDIIKGVINAVMRALKGDWEGAWKAILGIVTDIISNIVKAFKNVDLVGIGKDIINGLIKGIASMIGAVGKAARKIGKNIKDTFTGFFGIKSPSRMFMKFGGFISEGAAIGIDKAARLAEKASAALGLGVENAFNPQLATDGFDVAGQVDSINRQANRKMQSHLTSEVNVAQRQPAIINVHVGNKRIASEIVDDITDMQDRSANRRRKTPKGR